MYSNHKIIETKKNPYIHKHTATYDVRTDREKEKEMKYYLFECYYHEYLLINNQHTA